MTFLLYLGKVLLSAGILLGYYWIFLRNKRFHHYNRFYLLASLVLPIVLPFIKIKLWQQPGNPVNQVVINTLNVLTVDYYEASGAGKAPGIWQRLFTTENMLYLVYAIGILFLLVRLVKSLLYIYIISKRYPHEQIGGFTFYTTTEPGTPFSFFRSIFWNHELSFNSKEGQQIFRHELFHVQQKHTADILLAELITAVFWFNPFFHLLKKELKAVHEFLADQHAISGNDRYDYAELLVLQVAKSRQLSVTNYFFQNHIKRRIAMITHINTSRYSYWSRLMILPVSIVLFCTIALYAHDPAARTRSRAPFTVVIDAGHGSIDPGAHSLSNNIVEKDVVLQICQKIEQLAPNYDVHVVMTRTGDAFPLNATEIKDGLRARTTIAQQSNAAAFISLHMSAANNNDTRHSGLEVWVPYSNEKFTAASNQLGTTIQQSINQVYTTNPSLLRRTIQNIWVLEKAPCPAILIECGYITDDQDLAFFTNSDNQEALAKKILEGILKYKDQSQTVADQPANNATEDPNVLEKLVRYQNRNLSYPKMAMDHQVEDSVYFSIDVSPNGETGNLQLYANPPAMADKIHNTFVIGYHPRNFGTAEPLSYQERMSILQAEVKRVYAKKIILPQVATNGTTRYYIKLAFRIEKDA